MMNGFRLHHVGWAVHDVDVAALGFLTLGYTAEPTLPDTVDDNFGVALKFLRAPSCPAIIELVAPLRPRNSVSALLQRCGPGPYHLGYSVEDLATAARHMRAGSFRPTTSVIHAPALGLRRIQFFHKTQVGLVELIEWPNQIPCH